jgi:HEAT repeat protein
MNQIDQTKALSRIPCLVTMLAFASCSTATKPHSVEYWSHYLQVTYDHRIPDEPPVSHVVITQEDIRSLSVLLNSENTFLQWAALRTLCSAVELSDEIVPTLAGLLNHSEPRVRQLSAAVLSTHEGDAALPVLISALDHRDPAVRLTAIGGLSRFGSRAKCAVPRLIEMLMDPESKDRPFAAIALGWIGDIAAEDPLRAILLSDEGIESDLERHLYEDALNRIHDRE